jgi:hypothetical protein
MAGSFREAARPLANLAHHRHPGALPGFPDVPSRVPVKKELRAAIFERWAVLIDEDAQSEDFWLHVDKFIPRGPNASQMGEIGSLVETAQRILRRAGGGHES